ncbi:rmlD substrate binding domain protein [Acinetobacter baumannii 625974]|uniref:RmlD substrate binding domain protein n=1 Tax=Acinetobacter baumannii 625974 TaxID=1310607 RepID=A0A009QLU4_ACIBA|nr:rmlD substrate binding domain protein [Acinetobacter baumannii 625974]
MGEVVALDRHGLNGLSGDMAQPSAIFDTIMALRSEVVVNAFAYTAVDLAETE